MRILASIIVFLIYLAFSQIIFIGIGFIVSGGELNPLHYWLIGRILYVLYLLCAISGAAQGAREVTDL